MVGKSDAIAWVATFQFHYYHWQMISAYIKVEFGANVLCVKVHCTVGSRKVLMHSQNCDSVTLDSYTDAQAYTAAQLNKNHSIFPFPDMILCVGYRHSQLK